MFLNQIAVKKIINLEMTSHFIGFEINIGLTAA